MYVPLLQVFDQLRFERLGGEGVDDADGNVRKLGDSSERL
jgi:hypothetical protein